MVYIIVTKDCESLELSKILIIFGSHFAYI